MALTPSTTTPPAPRRSPAGTAHDVRRVLVGLGGLATRADLVGAVSAKALRTATDQGLVVRIRRGLYALPATAPAAPTAGASAAERSAARAERVAHARRTAASVGGVMSHRSAAEHYGLPLLVDPPVPEIALPRGGRGSSVPARTARTCRRVLTKDELTQGVTHPMRTVLDCAATLPDNEALAVVDSALRGDDDNPPLVARSQLLEAADHVARPDRARVRRLVAQADGGAANPSESALRHLALQVEGLQLETQVTITCGDDEYTVDVADRRRRLVLEFESHEWHNTKDGFAADCARYTALTSRGWMVLRFTWNDVMHHPETVVARIAAAVAAAA